MASRTEERTRVASAAPDADARADAERRLHQLGEHSIDHRRVEGRIEDVTPGTDRVLVVARRLTDDGRVGDPLPVSHPWDDDSRLSRLLDARGYGPGAVTMLEGERVTLVKRADGWEIEAPAREKRDRDRRLRRLARRAVLVALALAVAPVLIGAIAGADGLAVGALAVGGIWLGAAVLLAAGGLLAAAAVADRLRRSVRERRREWERWRRQWLP